MPIWAIPLIIIGALLFVLGLIVVLGRVAGGRPLRAVVQVLAKVPLFRKGLQKASQKMLQHQNPELASALRKMERATVTANPQQAQKALSRLTEDERRAYLAATTEQEGLLPPASNRQERRRRDRLQQQATAAKRPGAGGKRKR